MLYGLGRLASGASRDAARAELDAIARRLEARQATDGSTVVLTPIADYIFGPVRPALLLLLGVMALVLLVACANVASLLLVRAGARRRETAVRLALGASAPRILRQWLTETGLLSVLGGFGGLLPW